MLLAMLARFRTGIMLALGLFLHCQDLEPIFSHIHGSTIQHYNFSGVWSAYLSPSKIVKHTAATKSNILLIALSQGSHMSCTLFRLLLLFFQSMAGTKAILETNRQNIQSAASPLISDLLTHCIQRIVLINLVRQKHKPVLDLVKKVEQGKNCQIFEGRPSINYYFMDIVDLKPLNSNSIVHIR